MIPFDDKPWPELRKCLRDLLGRRSDVDEQRALLGAMRRQSKSASENIDRFFLEERAGHQTMMADVEATVAQLKEVHRRLTAPPWRPAVFLGFVSPLGDSESRMALVVHGSERTAVSTGEVDVDGLEPGDDVLLSEDASLLVGRLPVNASRFGETAQFERTAENGRLVLRSRDEEIVVGASGRLDTAELQKGDSVIWSRTASLALERLPRGLDRSRLIEETPDVCFDDIGGLQGQAEALKRSLTLHFFNPDAAERYRVARRGSVLLVGPPGTGKTMLAKALANWLGRLSSSGRVHFMNIKPAGLHSMWYGETERQYREVFRSARELAESEPDVPVVLFFDEVDSIGRRRGGSGSGIDDRVQTAFMTELDGLERRGQILVVSATNRREALDPALLRPGRLGDLVIDVPRPRREQASAIYEKHLPEGVPTRGARETLIAAGVSRLYAGGEDAEIARLNLRDGSEHVVRAPDLVSGAVIANIAEKAKERACLREVLGGAEGVGVEDILEATNEELVALTSLLSPSNAKDHLDALPQDLDVVRVQPVSRPDPGLHHYVGVA